ncbi:hypothetical protein VTK73DRAFT_10139 [Phialemonium thermophilum]|uniref:Uncharacterized protein n=1 Tax=Phialemonium thermophilum TaxID=223376 RepID=A0ABR3VYK9_9PEZI
MRDIRPAHGRPLPFIEMRKPPVAQVTGGSVSFFFFFFFSCFKEKQKLHSAAGHSVVCSAKLEVLREQSGLMQGR